MNSERQNSTAYPTSATQAPPDCPRGARRWVGTWNNYPEDAIEQLKRMKITLAWAIVSKEIAPTTGTPHLQIYLVFKNCVKFNTLRQLYPLVWWAPARGDNRENYLYVTKTRPERPSPSGGDMIPADVPNDPSNIFEWGTRPSFEALLAGIGRCIAYIDFKIEEIEMIPTNEDRWRFCSECCICDQHISMFEQELQAAYALLGMYNDGRLVDYS